MLSPNFRKLLQLFKMKLNRSVVIKRVRDTRLSLAVVFTALLLVSFVLMFWIMVAPSKTAEVRILVLDTVDDTSSVSENEGVWDVNGWTYYTGLSQLPTSMAKKNLMESSHLPKRGIWVLDLHEEKSDGRLHNWMRLKDFQYWSAKPVMLGLRFYIEGSATLEFRFTHTHGEPDVVSVVQDEEVDPSKGFCNKIVPPDADRLVESIDIRGFLQGDKSFIIIDQVLVTVGDNDSSQSMMYTIMPNEWCEVIHSDTTGSPSAKRGRMQRSSNPNAVPKPRRYSVVKAENKKIETVRALDGEEAVYLY